MKLYRFRYSPYARKVQMLLDLLGATYEIVEVSYTERGELAELTGGYIYVPVLVDEGGRVTCDSRAICEELLRADGAAKLVPSPLEGPIWAYHDFADGPLEDVMFRIGSPAVRDAWPTPGERALYTLIKERKFGAGCVDAWQRDRPALVGKTQRLLAPTLSTLQSRPFLFGREPTLADAALYGLCAMLDESEPTLLALISPALVDFARRLERAAQLASTSGASAKR
ncbi:MAG TPA: glutathione S-transferase family protein [Polyangiaceae bacterium]|nr:glutathione S-transferase family protein [Polyangiaceae bacterium]